MIECFPFAGYPVAVLGLGEEGRAAARALHLSEAEVSAWDSDRARRDGAMEDEIPVADLSGADWREFVSLVIEASVPHGTDPHPYVRAALDAGSEVISDAELLVRSQRLAEYVGVTGADGAEFTCQLIHYLLTLSGKEAEMGGFPLSPLMDLHPLYGGTYVLYMPPDKLDITVSITFDTACWIGPDGSGNGEDGLERQALIFHRQTDPRTAVVCVDDDGGRALFDRLAGVGDQIVVPVSGAGAVAGGIFIESGVLYDDGKGERVPVLPFAGLAAYDHRRDRTLAAVAYAAALSRGVEPPAAMASLRSFPGVEGLRAPLERVDGVLFIDDTASSTVADVERSLAGYDGPVVWIGGGDEPFGDDIADALAATAGPAVIVGRSAETLGEGPRVETAGDMAEAAEKAHALAAETGARVIYSPGVETERPDFAEAVSALTGVHEEPDEIDGIE